MRLVPAIVLARPDIDDADGDIRGARRPAKRRKHQRARGSGAEERAARKLLLAHERSPRGPAPRRLTGRCGASTRTSDCNWWAPHAAVQGSCQAVTKFVF